MVKINKSKLRKTGRVLTWEEERKVWQDAAGADVIKRLGSMSKEEYDYYDNLCLLK